MEFVFVIPRTALFRDCYPQGLLPMDRAERDTFDALVASAGFFVEREHAEGNPDLKQVIPYSIVHTTEGILLTRRLAQGGEDRLHDKLSIGVGGHINPVDLENSQGRDPIHAGTRREVAEELDVQGTYEVRAVGLLNDDSNPVGAVHVGLVQILELEGSVTIREEDTLEGRIVSLDELKDLKAQGANFETWSATLIDHIDALIPDVFPVTT